MTKIMIWGTGRYVDKVFDSIKLDKCEIIGFIDTNLEKQGNICKGQYMVYSPEQAVHMDFDYIVVSAMGWNDSITENAEEVGIDKNKIIFFWKNDVSKYDFINKYKKEIEVLKEENEKLRLRLNNAPFEYGPEIIKIKSSKELLEKILNERCSLCRFGDGEFDIILNQERSWFQKCNKKMAEKLKFVLQSNSTETLIAIADNYGNLDKYTEKAADGIRKYLTPQKRKQHVELLDVSRVYYDAYVSRPYIMYKDKNKNAEIVIDLYKKIFKDRNILMVEGKHTKTGIHNGLFDEAESVRRIVCPDMNSYDSYDKILQEVKNNMNKDDLILISLGATATILAYDLSMCGVQAIDFGQFDNEYEWYNMQSSDRTVIKGKAVSELLWYKFPNIEIEDSEYNSQIIVNID